MTLLFIGSFIFFCLLLFSCKRQIQFLLIKKYCYPDFETVNFERFNKSEYKELSNDSFYLKVGSGGLFETVLSDTNISFPSRNLFKTTSFNNQGWPIHLNIP